MRRVFKHLPKTLVGDQEAVHEMRVAARRLRVILPVLARKPAGRRVKRALVVKGGPADAFTVLSLLRETRDRSGGPSWKGLWPSGTVSTRWRSTACAARPGACATPPR
jgi:hypothetical protein